MGGFNVLVVAPNPAGGPDLTAEISIFVPCITTYEQDKIAGCDYVPIRPDIMPATFSAVQIPSLIPIPAGNMARATRKE
jgi:hypothetical protein